MKYLIEQQFIGLYVIFLVEFGDASHIIETGSVRTQISSSMQQRKLKCNSRQTRVSSLAN